MLKPLSDEEIQEAFDEDFTANFNHKPTEEEVHLIMLRQVARKAEREMKRQIVEWANSPCPHINTNDPQLIPRSDCYKCWRELKKEGKIMSDQSVQEALDKADMEEGLNSGGLTLITTKTAVALRPGEDVEARNHYEEALRLLEYAKKRVIASLEDNKAASDDLTIISRLKKTMEAKKREYLDPLRVKAEAIRETYSTLMDPILAAEKLTKDKMLAYDAEQRRIRAAQEEINRKRLEAAQEEMKLKGELSESVNLVEVIPEVSKRVSTMMGSSGQQDVWKWRVVNFALVEDQYKMINAGMVTPIVKASKGKITIPGIEIYNEPIIATRAR